MSGRTLLILAVLGVLVLIALTLETAPERPPSGLDHNSAGALAECQQAVADSIGEVRFPISPDISYLGERRYRIRGIVDGGPANDVIRRNYGCLIRHDVEGGYVADSVGLWQSH